MPFIFQVLLTPTSAMGKSRSATICIAYLLHQQPSALTPQSALALLRKGRPLCEPNDGFMEQLALYHEMGCPDDVTGHPLYNRWLYRREVEDSVACGRAPEMQSVLFEDEQPHRPQETSDRTTEIKCRKCRLVFLLVFNLDHCLIGSPGVRWPPRHSSYHIVHGRITRQRNVLTFFSIH
jgi:hypothetical protein